MFFKKSETTKQVSRKKGCYKYQLQYIRVKEKMTKKFGSQIDLTYEISRM